MDGNNFRKDLSNLVTDAAYYTDLTGSKIEQLDEMNDKYNEFIDDILTDKFKLDDDQIDDIGDTEEKLQYIKDNIWKLKPPAAGQMTEKSYFFGEQKFKIENEVRTDLEEIYKTQDETIKQNKEILDSFHNDLLADKEIVNALAAENAKLQQEIDSINASLSVLDSEILSKESEISSIESDIKDNKDKISEKESDSMEADKEINNQKLLKQQKQLEINNLTAEKKEVERQLKEAKRELENARRKDPQGNHSALIDEVKDLEGRNSDILKDINNAKTNISTIESLISDQLSRKTNNEKSIKQLMSENKNKEFSLTNARKEHTYKMSEKTKKDEMKIERQGKIASNDATIATYRIQEREKEYNAKFQENNRFVADIYKDREEIKKKFKDYKIEVPNSSGISKVQDGEDAPETSDDNTDKSQEKAGKDAKGGSGAGTPQAGGVAAPVDEKPELSDRELASNFVNDITKYGTSPEELRMKLSGYGYGTFVNALPHLNTLDRKKILKVLEERRNEVKTDPRDEIDVDDILGDGAYDLIMENGVPRDLNSLDADELRQLRKIIDNYNNNILDFDNDQIKLIEEKFFDTLSNSALISQYSKGNLRRAWDMHRVGNELLRRELLGSMKFYNQKKAERFKTVVDKGNTFFENLHREKNPVVVANPATSNVPELSHGRSSLQDEYRNR